MQGRQFLYLVRNAAGMYASFQSGYLTWSTAPVPLIYTPDGWMDLSIIEEMDDKLFGLNRTYGTPQNYVEDGAGILKTIFYTFGYNYVLNLIILEQQLYYDDVNYGYYHTQLVNCSIDLTTFSHQGEKVVAQLLEGDLKAMYTANSDTTYQVPIDPSIAKTINLSGLKLKQYANYLIQDPTDPKFTENGNNLIGLEVTSTEAKTQLGTQNVTRLKIDDNSAIFASNSWLLKNIPIETDFTIDVDFGLTVTLAPGVSPNPAIKYGLSLRVFDSAGNIVNYPGNTNLIVEIDGPDALYNHRHQITGTATVHLLEGYTVFLWSGVNVSNEGGAEGGDAVFFHYDLTTSTGNDTDSNVVINYDYQFPASLILGVDPLYILQYLIGQLSNGKYTAKSDYLLGLETQTPTIYTDPYCLYSSGDAVRGLPGTVIKWSIDDCFQSLNSTYNLGCGIVNNVFVVEPKAFWVTPPPGSQVIDLGDGSHYQCDLWTDILFNTIKIGCENETYDEALGDINGRYEFNMTHEYGTPVLGVNTELDLTSKARRDMYGIEYTRINLDGKTTTDADSDNDIFEINVYKSPIRIPELGGIIEYHYNLDRFVNQYVTGLLDNVSAFNIKLSPKHCLYRHGNYLRSVLDKMDLQSITFTTADKNTPMVTTYPNGMVVDERGNLVIGSLAPRIFLPYLFSDTTPSPEAAVQSNQIKKFSFNYNDGRIKIFGTSFKVGVQPVDYKVNAVQLLATPDNDMTQLIDIWD